MALPETIGRYQVLEELGSGAMGVVYLCVDPRLGRPVAVKVLRDAGLPDASQREQYRARFRQEAEAAGRVSHPDIVQIYDIGPSWLVMEYVEGQPLSAMAAGALSVNVGQVTSIILRVADALDCAHRQGVVHRDVKPANIMLTPDGAVKVMDFGVARIEHSKLTMAGTVVGSVRYMAPEQMMGETVDGRADVFSLGAVAYEILTGRPAFPGASITEIVARVVHGRHVPPREVDPRLPESLNDVFAKVFTRLPQDRYPRATDFAGEFQEVSAPVAALAVHHVLPSASPTEIIPPAAMARRVRQAAAPAKVAEPARVATSKSDAEKGRGSEGVLLLDSEPSPAKVWIDGHPAGETPLPRVDVTLGRHVVRMEAHGREAVSFAVELTAERPLKALTCALPVPHPANAKLKPGQFVPFGPEVVPPKRVRGHPPAYPEAAHERGLEGAPIVELWINEKGDVIDVAIVESAGALLDAALLEAVAGWNFHPATLRGTPVTVKLTVQHVFRR